MLQLAQDEMDSTRNEDRLHDFMKYKRKFNKMSQKKRIEELSEQEVRKTEITNSVYLGGKTNVSYIWSVYLGGKTNVSQIVLYPDNGFWVI